MSREIMDTPAPPADRRIAYGEGEHHFADLRLPRTEPPHPVVVVIHGGFWRAARTLHYAGHMAAALTRRGVATWNIEYRRIGHDGGGWPGTLDDVSAALDHLTTLPDLDLTRVVAIGHSAGGQLALWLAGRKGAVKLKSAVSLGGVADLEMCWHMQLGDGVATEFMGGSPEQFPARYESASPKARIPIRTPVRLIHGEQDDIVPIALAESYVSTALLHGDDAELIRLPDAGHFEIVNPDTPQWATVERTVFSLL